jgi:hypothetical protein
MSIAHALLGQIRISKFEIRHENIDRFGSSDNHFWTGITGAIIDEWQLMTFLAKPKAQGFHMRPKMIRAYKIEIVYLLLDQMDSHAMEVFCRHQNSMVFQGNISILAEKTPAGASAKKDRSRTVPAAEKRFFAMMRKTGCHPTLSAFPANPLFPLQAVNSAITRT